MPVHACLMTAIHPSCLLACQACQIEFSSGVRLPDRQIFPAIHYEACMFRRACHACLIVYGRPMAGKTWLSDSLTPDENTIRHAWQTSRHDGCMAVIRHAWTGISYQLCLVGGYYVIYPLNFLCLLQSFSLTFLCTKNWQTWQACLISVCALQGVRHACSSMPHSVWPAQ